MGFFTAIKKTFKKAVSVVKSAFSSGAKQAQSAAPKSSTTGSKSKTPIQGVSSGAGQNMTPSNANMTSAKTGFASNAPAPTGAGVSTPKKSGGSSNTKKPIEGVSSGSGQNMTSAVPPVFDKNNLGGLAPPDLSQGLATPGFNVDKFGTAKKVAKGVAIGSGAGLAMIAAASAVGAASAVTATSAALRIGTTGVASAVGRGAVGKIAKGGNLG